MSNKLIRSRHFRRPSPCPTLDEDVVLFGDLRSLDETPTPSPTGRDQKLHPVGHSRPLLVRRGFSVGPLYSFSGFLLWVGNLIPTRIPSCLPPFRVDVDGWESRQDGSGEGPSADPVPMSTLVRKSSFCFVGTKVHYFWFLQSN